MGLLYPAGMDKHCGSFNKQRLRTYPNLLVCFYFFHEPINYHMLVWINRFVGLPFPSFFHRFQISALAEAADRTPGSMHERKSSTNVTVAPTSEGSFLRFGGGVARLRSVEAKNHHSKRCWNLILCKVFLNGFLVPRGSVVLVQFSDLRLGTCHDPMVRRNPRGSITLAKEVCRDSTFKGLKSIESVNLTSK